MQNIEKKIHKYLKDRGWDSLRPADLAKSIAIESGELLELFQWENLSLDEVKKSKAKKEEISKELADVLIYCIEMTVLLGLDTEKIILRKLAHTSKKYPAHIMKKNAKKDSGSGEDSEYWRIKREYRRRGA